MHTLLAQSQLTVQDQGTKGHDRASNQSLVGVSITNSLTTNQTSTSKDQIWTQFILRNLWEISTSKQKK